MSKHLVIIGGGVIGLCTAHYAVQRGHRVTLIERLPRGHDGCSFGNAGMIVPSHFFPLAAPGIVGTAFKWMWNPESPFHIKPRLDFDLLSWGWKFMRASTSAHVRRAAPLIRDLSFASRACFEELAATLDFGLVKRGLLMLSKTQHALDEEAKTAALAVELGIPAEVFDAKATAALDPGVRMDVAGSVYFPRDCHLSPGRLMAALHEGLERAGAKFSHATAVTGWRTSGRRVTAVRTDKGEFTADEYVLCGGSWSPGVARDLRVRLPMQAGKGYSLTLTNPRQLPQICAIFSEARVAVTPMGGTLRFGGTMEIAGLSERINPRRVRGIIHAIPRYYPDFTPADFEGVRPWSGLRPCSPDGLLYVGRFAAYDNLSTATGHAMMGLSLGPVTGRLIAEMLSGEKPSLDLTLLSPDRYA
ncbi:MAG: FAD-dependent oxidoreductase [Chthoniobacteraceae bacterium]